MEYRYGSADDNDVDPCGSTSAKSQYLNLALNFTEHKTVQINCVLLTGYGDRLQLLTNA
jgi:hypothetical protein